MPVQFTNVENIFFLVCAVIVYFAFFASEHEKNMAAEVKGRVN